MKITSIIIVISILITTLVSCISTDQNNSNTKESSSVFQTDNTPESTAKETEPETETEIKTEAETEPETKPEDTDIPTTLKLDNFTIVYDSSNKFSYIPKLANAMGTFISAQTNKNVSVIEDGNEEEFEILIGKCNRDEYKEISEQLLFRDFHLYFENNKLTVNAVSIYGYEEALQYLLDGYGKDGLVIPKEGLTVSYDYGSGVYADLYKNYENFYITGSWVVNVCHRGDVTSNLPENSIPAYQSCIDNNVDIIETDLKKTKDGVWVICHDTSIDRTTNGRGNISQLLYKDIKKVNLKTKNGGSGSMGTVYKMPTLNEIIDLCYGKTLLNLDHITSDMFDDVYGVFEAKNAIETAMFKSSDMSADQLTDWFCRLLVEGKKLPLYSPLLYGNRIDELEEFSGLTSMIETGRDHNSFTLEKAKEANLRLMCLTALNPDFENKAVWNILISKGYGGIMNDSPILISKVIHGE